MQGKRTRRVHVDHMYPHMLARQWKKCSRISMIGLLYLEGLTMKLRNDKLAYKNIGEVGIEAQNTCCWHRKTTNQMVQYRNQEIEELNEKNEMLKFENNILKVIVVFAIVSSVIVLLVEFLK